MMLWGGVRLRRGGWCAAARTVDTTEKAAAHKFKAEGDRLGRRRP